MNTRSPGFGLLPTFFATERFVIDCACSGCARADRRQVELRTHGAEGPIVDLARARVDEASDRADARRVRTLARALQHHDRGGRGHRVGVDVVGGAHVRRAAGERRASDDDGGECTHE